MGGSGDAVEVFIDVSRNGSSLGVIGTWVEGRRVEVLGKMDDVAPVESSACGGGSYKGGSRLLKAKEAVPSEGIGQLGINLSGN